MKVGAEPKKLAILGGLVLAGGYLFYANVLSGPDTGAPSQPPARPAAARADATLPAAPASAGPIVRRSGSRSRISDEWHPTLRRRPDDHTDPMSIDPTLRLDLLAKVQAVDLQGGARSVFQFSTPPPPPAPKGPEPKIIPKLAAAQNPPKMEPAGPPKPPPPPPILLKYYGYSSGKGAAPKTAFFLDGDDVLVAHEGETLKRRYRVVKIGLTSVVMEDTESQNRQTLPLVQDPTMG